LDRLAPAYAGEVARLAARGFAPLRADWLARAAGIGRPAVARTMTGEIRGTIETLDPTGALVLSTPAGPRAVAAADIYF
jgi:BirA family biotin operon repressor/biotin-[acetyl-CoA-carboxylase] ligase